MNKQLLASTALVAAGMLMAPSMASAAGKTVKLGLHGYMEQLVGVALSTVPTVNPRSRAQSRRRLSIR